MELLRDSQGGSRVELLRDSRGRGGEGPVCREGPPPAEEDLRPGLSSVKVDLTSGGSSSARHREPPEYCPHSVS